jgi:hypothetical protein
MAMHHFYLTGLIYRVSPESLLPIIQTIAGSAPLKEHFQGYEILLQTKEADLHFNSMNGNHSAWSMNGYFHGQLENFKALIISLENKLVEMGGVYSIGYQAEDSEGNEQGDEVQINHPDFATEYRNS